ncbi:hypothetical protein [Companilactobacillus ginsenosidimutans]|uniref:Uncharacterized protein n=1 Tax=Companilactobacillus ginsenosidimutans TaxID=1007676 RepID=A0A0H4QH47_9LACO|nr:hypothetical protein [Companilactobacillus ginsenosidimutans]AKP67734.1 hypothetical protein ABM34_09475 [Companilactobacillus ginsenosidimutans]
MKAKAVFKSVIVIILVIVILVVSFAIINKKNTSNRELNDFQPRVEKVLRKSNLPGKVKVTRVFISTGGDYEKNAEFTYQEKVNNKWVKIKSGLPFDGRTKKYNYDFNPINKNDFSHSETMANFYQSSWRNSKGKTIINKAEDTFSKLKVKNLTFATVRGQMGQNGDDTVKILNSESTSGSVEKEFKNAVKLNRKSNSSDVSSFNGYYHLDPEYYMKTGYNSVRIDYIYHARNSDDFNSDKYRKKEKLINKEIEIGLRKLDYSKVATGTYQIVYTNQNDDGTESNTEFELVIKNGEIAYLSVT